MRSRLGLSRTAPRSRLVEWGLLVIVLLDHDSRLNMSAWNAIKPMHYMMLVLGDCGVVACCAWLSGARQPRDRARTDRLPASRSYQPLYFLPTTSCACPVEPASTYCDIVPFTVPSSTATLYRSEINDAHCSRPKTPHPNLIIASTSRPTYLSLSV
jgi:hypothetical protein